MMKGKHILTCSTGFMLDHEALIQVRKMREQDLESQVYLHESEHEDYLDVIKLPLPIQIEKNLDYKDIEHESHHHSKAYVMYFKLRFSIL